MVEVFSVLGQALGIKPGLFLKVDDDPWLMLWSALAIALLASASTLLGQIAVLTLNRVERWRLLSSLVLSMLILAGLKVIEMAVTWSVASLVLRRPVPLLPLFIVALLSTAPLVFNFVTATPFLGLFFGRLLEAWSYLIVLVGVSHAFDVRLTWSLGFTLAGWLVIQLLSRLGQRPLNWLASHLWTLATGRPTMVTSQDILAGTPIIPVSHRTGESA